MANNCYNYINIDGKQEEIKLLVSEFQDKNLDGYDVYRNICTAYKRGEQDGRWFDMDLQELSDTEIIISGDSAWCPSLELFTNISAKLPSLIIHYEYEEMGCDFSGWADISEGNCTDNCFDYWTGKKEMDYAGALESVINNELDCYESEEELIESTMYKAFHEDDQKTILETWKENNQQTETAN